jgi:lipid-binding SYLF domain-containing protein
MRNHQTRKIIYFDKETIRNILQERNKGNKQTQTEVSTSVQSSAEVEVEASVKVNMPIILRLSFLFTGRMGAKFLIRRDVKPL